MPRLRRRSTGPTSPSRRWSIAADRARSDDRLSGHLMLEGVVQRGTGTVLRDLGRPIAGKTGTTNDEKDVWFIGFTPDLVVGVYIGYDRPRCSAPRHRRRLRGADRERIHEAGARRHAGAAVPRAARHQAHSHQCEHRHPRRPQRRQGDPGSLQARHRAGDPFSVIGFTDETGRPLIGPDQQRPWGITPEADRAVGRGPFGLW